ncbi:MAG: hypothetical protein RQ847_02065 [Wenzhouxiangellaceae bacterium]|nr:hypothetical protein [Wenzhouxiangellaceae bacterium]
MTNSCLFGVVLEQSLAGLFEDSRETDCGFMRYFSAGGETEMTLQCREQKLLGDHAKLALEITHEPTSNAMFSQAVVRDDADEPETEDAPVVQEP